MMNWTGGALNRHSNSHNSRADKYKDEYNAGKSFQKRGQAFAQRLHFARLRKEKWRFGGGGRYGSDGTRRVSSGDGDRNGDEAGDETSMEFVPEWERGKMRRRMSGECDGLKNGGVGSREYGRCHDYGHYGKRGQKTLREFEELTMMMMEEREVGEREFEAENNIASETYVKRRYSSERNDDDNGYVGEGVNDSGICSGRSERGNDDQGNIESDSDHTSEEGEMFDRKRQYLLRHKDWAGLGHCHFETHYPRRRSTRRGRNSYNDSSGSIDYGMESLTRIADKAETRKRRQREIDEFDSDNYPSTQAASGYKRRSDNQSMLCANSPLRKNQTEYRPIPLPLRQALYKRKRNWHISTKPNSVDMDIDDQDISVRVGSDALASEASRSYLSATKKGKKKNRQWTVETEGDDGKDEGEDLVAEDLVAEDFVQCSDDTEIDNDNEEVNEAEEHSYSDDGDNDRSSLQWT